MWRDVFATGRKGSPHSSESVQEWQETETEVCTSVEHFVVPDLMSWPPARYVLIQYVWKLKLSVRDHVQQLLS